MTTRHKNCKYYLTDVVLNLISDKEPLPYSTNYFNLLLSVHTKDADQNLIGRTYELIQEINMKLSNLNYEYTQAIRVRTCTCGAPIKAGQKHLRLVDRILRPGRRYDLKENLCQKCSQEFLDEISLEKLLA